MARKDLPEAEFLLEGAEQRHAGNATFRATDPVCRIAVPSGGTAWLVTGYEAARQALSDLRLRGRTGAVGDRRRLPEELHHGMNTHMLNLEPPDHTRLRRLVSAVFTQRRTRLLQPRIQQITDQLLDDMAGKDEVDLIASLALPLPMRVLAELLGIPVADTDEIHRWTAILTDNGVSPDCVNTAGNDMLYYVRDLLEQKRRKPGDDLLSALCAVRDGDDRLTENELTSMAFLFLIAGQETTVNLIANGTCILLQHPTELARLRAEPELTISAVEEFLRFESPVQAAVRYSTEPIELAGTTIPARSVIIVSLLAANRDSVAFATPDTFDPTRIDNSQIAFGYGIHHCLGAPLARLEGSIAIRSLLTRFPGIRLACPVDKLRWRTSVVMHGLVELPVHLG